MSDFYIGQIMMVGFDFAPKYWAQCNGQLLPIQQNAALFSLLGTTYGGNGTTNFALPSLQGRAPIGTRPSVDSSWQPPATQMGEVAGAESVTLLSNNLPGHTHSVNATSGAGSIRFAANNVYASNAAPTIYAVPGATVALNAATVGTAGGNQPHSNMQPYAVTNFCIALSGIFPSRN